MKFMKDKLDEKKVVGIDGRCLLDVNYTGVSEYTVTLIKKLVRDYPSKEFVIFLNSFKTRGVQERLAWLRNYKNVRVKHYHYPSKLLNFCLWFFTYPKIDKMLGEVDIFIAPNISFLAVSKKVKFILTVHDLSFERFKETFSWKRRLWHFVVNPRKLCKNADEIWTVSESTKWDLESLYKLPAKKIKVKPIVREMKCVIDNKNVAKTKLRSVQKKYNLPERFILYLGTIEPRKNVVSLLRAFEYLKENNKIAKDYHLVIAGQLGWRYKKIVEAIELSKFRKDILLTDFVESEDKPSYYQLADVFVYPSLFEGFGIPVLEAMINGAPVVTSNNSSLPEVVGRVGIMIDPDSVDDLIDAIDLLINDRKLRDYYVQEGFEQAKRIVSRSVKMKLLE